MFQHALSLTLQGEYPEQIHDVTCHLQQILFLQVYKRKIKVYIFNLMTFNFTANHYG